MDYGQRPTLGYHKNLFQVFNMSKEYNSYNGNFILHNLIIYITFQQYPPFLSYLPIYLNVRF